MKIWKIKLHIRQITLQQFYIKYHISHTQYIVVGANGRDTQSTHSPRTELSNDTIESKSTYPAKEIDIKARSEAEAKKKTADFKIKADQKYQKPFINDSKKLVDSDASSTSPMAPLAKFNHSSMIAEPVDVAGATIPFLLHGVPLVAVTKTIPTSNSAALDATGSSTEQTQVTEETTSSRGRALNISAPEPTNSLHVNITDLSDVSMDEDDKEVEGERATLLKESSKVF